MLRLYRNYNTACNELCAFVLPASVRIDVDLKVQQKRRCPVLKVSLKWNPKYLHFESRLKPIPNVEELLQEMKKCALDNWQQWACHFESDWEFSGFFLPVSSARLNELFGNGAMQIPSGKSIVVVNPVKKYVYKMIVSLSKARFFLDILSLFRVENSTIPADFLCLPESVTGLPLGFMRTPLLIYPLIKAEAVQCFKDFIIKAAEAVQTLHDYDYVHLDIRLENVCFRHNAHGDVNAVLIDFEYMQQCSTAPTNISVESSMGIMEPSFQDTRCLDWKQFGLMAAFVLETNEINHKKYHDDKFIFEAERQNSFVKCLIRQGEMDCY